MKVLAHHSNRQDSCIAQHTRQLGGLLNCHTQSPLPSNAFQSMARNCFQAVAFDVLAVQRHGQPKTLIMRSCTPRIRQDREPMVHFSLRVF